LRRKPYAALLALTLAALFVHGYHPAAEDGEIYIPPIKKLLNPALYPFGSEFFLNHAKLTLFDELIAASVRVSHVPFDWAVFLWYLASIFLTLLACWKWSNDLFTKPEARWAGVAMVAALLTMPVAGTALYIFDPYLTTRSLILFAMLFATWHAWHGRLGWFAAWSVFGAVIHPLMAGFGISFALLLIAIKYRSRVADLKAVPAHAVLLLLPFVPLASPAYHQAVVTRSYFFILRWEWYEWLGIFGPLVLLWWFGSIRGHENLRPVGGALIVYSLFYLACALFLTIPERFETAARLQPMRNLHLVYVFLVVLGGGLLGAHVLKRHAWRWIVLFLPLTFGMWYAQRQLFPISAHIEWPGAAPSNDWLRAFEWIRSNTPVDALFAMNPNYMLSDDQHGFRAVAERSRLADAVKDSGAVTMFPEPPAAEHWLEQSSSQMGWRDFQPADFDRLKAKYGVNWIVWDGPSLNGMVCPYRNATISVCGPF
jgi:hypothetical protein